MKKIFFLFFILILRNAYSQNIQITKFRTTDDLQDSVYKADNQLIILDFRKTHLLISYNDTIGDQPVSYAYRLLGFEKKWVSVKTQNFANYTNLLGGEYEFQVQNQRFPNKIASVKFHIKEAFWQSGWFIPAILAYLLLVSGIIFYFFQIYRFRQQIRLQKVRNDIAADLHDDIGATLSNISFLTEIAKSRLANKPQDLPFLLDKILADAKEMILTMRGMIWTINPSNDTAADFFMKVESFVKEVLKPYEIKLIFDVQLPESQRFNLEVQRNVFLVFKEAINNITKYANAENVKIVVRKEKDWLMIQIKDDGIGFDLGEEIEGNGLRNMKNRVEQLGGIFDIKSDDGTRLRFTILTT